MSSRMTMWVLLLTVFLNLVGFGLILPLFPLYAKGLGVSPEMITFIMGAYSVGQFLTAPLWGRLSDSIGRRPVMIISLVGFTVAYIFLAYANSAESLFFARCLAGVFAGNLAISYAYMNDITTGAERAKGMGIIGAAFGVGLIVGPAIAAVIALIVPADTSFFITSWAAALLSLVALVGTYFYLPETLKEENRKPLTDWKIKVSMPKADVLMARPVLLVLLIISFLSLTSISVVTSTMALWMVDRLGAGDEQVALVYVAVGAISAIIQGGLIGPLTAWLGDWKLMMAGVVIQCLGLFFMGLSSEYILFALAIVLMSMGSSVSNPAITSLVSKEAKDNEAGAVLGIFTSSGSLGRVIGPWSSGPIYANVSIAAPFFFGAALMLPAVLGGLFIRSRISEKEAVEVQS